MSRPSGAAASSAPALDGGVILEEILEEILLRLPPQPSSLPRASLVCTRWRRILSNPSFHRRFREHHRLNKPPPLLGLFDKEFRIDDPPTFNPTMGGRDRIPPERFSSPWRRGEGWAFLGCRHGLALLICQTRREAFVWDPLTGHQRRVAFPPGFSEKQGEFVWTAAVMCAAAQDGHVHGDCRFTPFRLVLVCTDSNSTPKFACLYESESGVWGDIVSVATTHSFSLVNTSVLIRDSFCWLLCGGAILEFDFQSQTLAVIQKPADAEAADYYWFSCVVRIEHSGLGLVVLSKSEYLSNIIQLWERKSKCHGIAEWKLQKNIQLHGSFHREPCGVMRL